MTAKPILPGTPFEIEVAGINYTVMALTGKEQQSAAECLQATIDAERAGQVTECYAQTLALLAQIFGQERAEELWGTTVDAQIALEIARKVLNKAQVSEGEEKN